MKNLRTLIQEALDIEGLDAGVPIPDDLVVDGETYFGYTLDQGFIDSDFNRNYSMRINLNGHLVRKNNSEENTLAIMDDMLEKIKEALKSLNMKYDYSDVTIDDNVRKIHITATVRYNEINYWLI